jgi:hypothetical protein
MIAHRRSFAIAFAIGLGVAAIPSPAHAQPGNSRVFGDLLKRIPEQANALMLVNLDGLFDSPMGRRENWRQEAMANFRSRFGLAPEFSKIAVAVGLDFNSMQERWKVGMAQLRHDVPIKLENLAAREGGYVETIENLPVAWTPRGFYLFDFPDKIVGFVSPTDRQGVVKWIQSALDHPRNFPPGFADRAIFRADLGAQIVLAFNLVNAISAKEVEPWLGAIDVIKKTKTEPKLLAPRLASAKAAFLVVQVDQGIQGNIRIDFDQPVSYTAPVFRELILNLLEDYGADLPEIRTWTLSFDRKTNAAEMEGRLSEASVRKILSLAHLPSLSPERSVPTEASTRASAPAADKAASRATTNAETRGTSASGSDVVNASQGYFRSVVSLIEGLKGTERPTYRSTKLWYDRYAKQIEELSILGVDKDLLDWGAQVSRTFREMSTGINYYAQNQKYTVASDPNGAYAGYGYWYANSKSYDASVIKKQSDSMMSVDLDKIWQKLEISIADMRRKMVEKYKVDF